MMEWVRQLGWWHEPNWMEKSSSHVPKHEPVFKLPMKLPYDWGKFTLHFTSYTSHGSIWCLFVGTRVLTRWTFDDIWPWKKIMANDVGVSENVVYPFLPNGFADHDPVFKWLAIIGKINPTCSDKPMYEWTNPRLSYFQGLPRTSICSAIHNIHPIGSGTHNRLPNCITGMLPSGRETPPGSQWLIGSQPCLSWKYLEFSGRFS